MGLASQCLDDDQDLHAARRPCSHGDSFARSAVLVEFHWSVVRCVHILGGVVRRDDDAMTKNDQTKRYRIPTVSNHRERSRSESKDTVTGDEQTIKLRSSPFLDFCAKDAQAKG